MPTPVLDPSVRPEDLAAVAEEARSCTRCHLHELDTRVVFGEGPLDARLVLVGEQPGDREDREGRPFVGPAGRVLDDGLAAAGIDRSVVYVTNVVKRFRFEARGKRRIHATPQAEEILACRPWLDAELSALRPDVVVALGATAAQALYGKAYRVTKQRGQVEDADGIRWTSTVHPSSILRGPAESRAQAEAAFVEDLRRVAELLA